MANALEAASLVMIPSGYEDGTLGSLKPTDGSGDFTFSRGSNLSATRINEQGYIEKGYENLLLQSNSFLTTWTTYQAILTSGQAGYDGTNDAWLLEASSTGLLTQTLVNSGIQTFSIYAKAGTTDWIKIRFFGGSTTYINFDLNPSTTGSRIGDSQLVIDAATEDVGNGWFHCSFSINNATTSFRIRPMSGDNIDGIAGDNIYIQDAMLNQGLVAYPYIETTTAPVAGGILEDMPRLDWSGSCPSLLLEPSRTNLIVQSEYLGSSWVHINTNYESNATASPEGLINSTKVFANTSSGNHYFERQGYTGFTSGNYTYSFFAKSAGSDFVQIATSSGFDSRYQNFNLTTGQKTSGDADLSGYDTSITALGDDGWYRLTITANAPSMASISNLNITAKQAIKPSKPIQLLILNVG